MGISRRDFLKMLGIGTGAVALGGVPEVEFESAEIIAGTVEETELDSVEDISPLLFSNNAVSLTVELPDGRVLSGRARAVAVSADCFPDGPACWDIDFQGVGPLKVKPR